MPVTPDTQGRIDAILARVNTPERIYSSGGLRTGYDPQRSLWFTTTNNGPRNYDNGDYGIPESVAGSGREVSFGRIQPTRGGGGLIHGAERWDSRQGKFIRPLSPDKLLSYAAGSIITGGAANAYLAAHAAPGAIAGAGGGLAPGAGLPALPSTAGSFGAGTAGSTIMPAATTGGPSVASQAIGPGINAATNLYGGKQQGRANNRADAQDREAARAAEAAQEVRDKEDLRRWGVDQANRERDRVASEEQRAFERGQAERLEADRAAQRVIEARNQQLAEEDRARRQRLEDERDARQAPYRAASAAALGRLGGLMGGGQNNWRSPSNAGRAGTLGSMVGR